MMNKIMQWVREFFKRKDVQEAEQKLVHAVMEKVEDAIEDAISDEPKATQVEVLPAADAPVKAKKPRKKRNPAAKKAAAKKAK